MSAAALSAAALPAAEGRLHDLAELLPFLVAQLLWSAAPEQVLCLLPGILGEARENCRGITAAALSLSSLLAAALLPAALTLLLRSLALLLAALPTALSLLLAALIAALPLPLRALSLLLAPVWRPGSVAARSCLPASAAGCVPVRPSAPGLGTVPEFRVLPRRRQDPRDALPVRPDALKQRPHVDRDHAFELLHGLAREDIGGGRGAQALDRARYGVVRYRVQPDQRLLAFAQVGPLGLLHAREEFHLREIQQPRHGHARRDLVALADFRERLPEAAAPPGSVLLDGDQACQWSKRPCLRNPATVARHVQLRLVELLAQDSELGLALLQAVLDVFLQLLLPADSLL